MRPIPRTLLALVPAACAAFACWTMADAPTSAATRPTTSADSAPAATIGQPTPDADGFVPMFDGKTLAGWRAPDMSFWRVEDGAITGEVTADHKPKENVFLIWLGDGSPAGGIAGDFDLVFRFRVFGKEPNSGMQFRSEVTDTGLVRGYQADIDGVGKFAAGIWDEYGPRRSLAARGEKVTWTPDGKRTVTGTTPDPLGGAGGPPPDLTQWTEYRLVARGEHVTLSVNGKLACELTDQDKARQQLKGVFAVPVISKEMKVQYKDLKLKRL